MSKKGLYWICQVGGWLFFILFNSLLAKLGNAFSMDVARSLLILLVYGIIISHQYRNLIVRLGWLQMRTLAIIPRVVIAALAFGTLLEYAQYFTEQLTHLSESTYNPKIILYNIFQLAFLFFFWSVIYFLFHYIENYKRAEIENLKWAASINEIELNKLKSQLNPHFMFNAMNSIRALVDEDPEKSKEAITQLSNILRNTLQMGKNKLIPFDEEMKIVNDYLQLESIRYEERLKTSVNIAPGSSAFAVPPLMLQTLVENAIKHGISKLTRGGVVEIRSFIKEEKLHIVIRNSGQLDTKRDPENGFGIKNTIQRLQLLYGDNAAMKIQNEGDEFVMTELVIPRESIVIPAVTDIH